MIQFLDECKLPSFIVGRDACDRWMNLSTDQRQKEGYTVYQQWVSKQTSIISVNVTFEESKWYFKDRPERDSAVQLPKSMMGK